MSDSLAVKAGKALKAKAAELYEECIDKSNASTKAEKKQCTDGVANFLNDVTENSDNVVETVKTFLNSKLSGFDRKGNPLFAAQDGTTKSPITVKK